MLHSRRGYTDKFGMHEGEKLAYYSGHGVRTKAGAGRRWKTPISHICSLHFDHFLQKIFINSVFYLRLFIFLKTIQTICLLHYFVIIQIMLQMTSKSPRVRPHILMKLLQIIFDQSLAWRPAGGFWCRTLRWHHSIPIRFPNLHNHKACLEAGIIV